MSTKVPEIKPGPDETMSLRELTEVLVRHYGFAEGYYDLLIQFQIGMGSVGPNAEEPLPGAMIGVRGFGLKKVDEIRANTVDAKELHSTTN